MAAAPKKRKGKQGYLHRSPAICVVVHDPGGRAMPNSVANEILERVTEIALREGYLINYTRT